MGKVQTDADISVRQNRTVFHGRSEIYLRISLYVATSSDEAFFSDSDAMAYISGSDDARGTRNLSAVCHPNAGSRFNAERASLAP
jgi:hypothetical protein